LTVVCDVLQPVGDVVPALLAAPTLSLSVTVRSSATNANSLLRMSGPPPYRPAMRLRVVLSRFQYSSLPSVSGFAPVCG